MAAKTKLTRQITIETYRVTIIRAKGKSPSAYCKQCRTTVSALTLQQMAALWQTSPSDICEQIESGRFHLVSIEGLALICSNSLEKVKGEKNDEL